MTARALPETCCPDQRTLWLWPARAIYLGPSFDLDAHSGSVHCFALGVDAPFDLHSAETGRRRTRSAFIPARTEHHIVATGRVLFSYADSLDVRDHMTEHSSTVAFTHRDELALLQHLQHARPVSPEFLRGHLDRGTAIDERIRAATQTLQADPARVVSAAALAAEVNLSTSRFLHLFAQHTGTSFRRYRLWARMTKVGHAISTGANITTAATDAGFASANHFSDTFHAMFGLTATALLAAGTRVVIQDNAAAEPPHAESRPHNRP
ncbi:AraC family transcriptional regulator [Kibdelosporangium aridum]|uniref:AraC family transcriptional regulator n=1 Tax=Kibdelosporangium aridum TaxID=2030 RepID=UPI0035E94552